MVGTVTGILHKNQRDGLNTINLWACRRKVLNTLAMLKEISFVSCKNAHIMYYAMQDLLKPGTY